MDPTIALLLPLIGGHQFIIDYKSLKYKVARQDGHRLYFRVAHRQLMDGKYCSVVLNRSRSNLFVPYSL